MSYVRFLCLPIERFCVTCFVWTHQAIPGPRPFQSEPGSRRPQRSLAMYRLRRGGIIFFYYLRTVESQGNPVEIESVRSVMDQRDLVPLEALIFFSFPIHVPSFSLLVFCTMSWGRLIQGISCFHRSENNPDHSFKHFWLHWILTAEDPNLFLALIRSANFGAPFQQAINIMLLPAWRTIKPSFVK